MQCPCCHCGKNEGMVRVAVINEKSDHALWMVTLHPDDIGRFWRHYMKPGDILVPLEGIGIEELGSKILWRKR